MSIPSSLQKVGYIPPTMTTFKKRSLICLSYRSYLCVKTQSFPQKIQEYCISQIINKIKMDKE